jgi:hypothetical protein
MNFSRRGFLKAMGAGAGAMVGTRIAGDGLIGTARAATPEPTAVVVVYFDGGINAIFTGADAFTGQTFGVTANNVTNMGGVVVDNTLASVIPAGIRNRVASVGIRHGISDHGNAQRSLFRMGNASAPLMLADAIGGTGAIKAAVVGGNSLPNGVQPAPVNGVSLQPINDMRATIEAVAGAANQAANVADRAGAAKGVAAAQVMSKGAMVKHATSLASIDQGLTAAVATLNKPVQPFNVNEFNTAYGLQGTGIGGNFRAKMAAAELMVRSGTNFVIAQDGGWDTHGDTTGNNVRNQMTREIAPGLGVFLQRMVEGAAGERNVIVAIFGDFHRSLPGSDHQANLSALVIGKTLKNATTGKTDARVGLPPNTPSVAGLWQMLSAASKVDTSPFGANTHNVLA